MAHTGTAAKRNCPAWSLHYFSRCACLPFPHATVCFVLAGEFHWLNNELGTFFLPTKNFSPLKSNCEATAFHAASEITPNFNKPSLYWRQSCCLFPSLTASWALVQAPDWPVFHCLSWPLSFSLSPHSCCFVGYLRFQLASGYESSPLHLLP